MRESNCISQLNNKYVEHDNSEGNETTTTGTQIPIADNVRTFEKICTQRKKKKLNEEKRGVKRDENWIVHVSISVKN